MKKLFPLLSLVFLLPQMNFAQETYAEDIAPIIYKNCSTCHRQGEIGPLSLTNYEEVANWGDMIK